MDAYLLDWVNLLLRWAHLITGVAWIGSSFYFVGLDNSLRPPTDPALREKGVAGELWAVHGGGFYNPQKYAVAPAHLPDHLHWSMWESYSTWLTGFALFTVLYLFSPTMFLIDPRVHAWTPAGAVVGALGFLAAFWLIYDLICRAFGERTRGDLIVGTLVFIFVVFASWLACHLFAGRAAFLLVGAMLATTMSANVFFWIIPGQRRMVAAMRAGQPVDPRDGKRGKQRSTHNTYFTLPVLVAMISNHYGFAYSHEQNWLVLVLVMLAGALIRHAFVARHKAQVLGKRTPWEIALAGCVLIAGVVVWIRPAPAVAEAAAPQGAVSITEVQTLLSQRCIVCHNIDAPSKNVRLDAPEQIRANAQRIYQQAVVLKLMPLNNATQITPQERELIGRWYQSQAPATPRPTP